MVPVEGHPEISLSHRREDTLAVPCLQQAIQHLGALPAVMEGEDGSQPASLEQEPESFYVGTPACVIQGVQKSGLEKSHVGRDGRDPGPVDQPQGLPQGRSLKEVRPTRFQRAPIGQPGPVEVRRGPGEIGGILHG
jgi:hypothetical protein